MVCLAGPWTTSCGLHCGSTLGKYALVHSVDILFVHFFFIGSSKYASLPYSLSIFSPSDRVDVLAYHTVCPFFSPSDRVDVLAYHSVCPFFPPSDRIDVLAYYTPSHFHVVYNFMFSSSVFVRGTVNITQFCSPINPALTECVSSHSQAEIGS